MALTFSVASVAREWVPLWRSVGQARHLCSLEVPTDLIPGGVPVGAGEVVGTIPWGWGGGTQSGECGEGGRAWLGPPGLCVPIYPVHRVLPRKPRLAAGPGDGAPWRLGGGAPPGNALASPGLGWQAALDPALPYPFAHWYLCWSVGQPCCPPTHARPRAQCWEQVGLGLYQGPQCCSSGLSDGDSTLQAGSGARPGDSLLGKASVIWAVWEDPWEPGVRRSCGHKAHGSHCG